VFELTKAIRTRRSVMEVMKEGTMLKAGNSTVM